MMKPVFFGGYDKDSVLKAVDSLNMRIIQLANAAELKKAGKCCEPLEPMPEIVLKKARLGGFCEDDVNAFINDLKDKIAELEKELNAEL